MFFPLNFVQLPLSLLERGKERDFQVIGHKSSQFLDIFTLKRRKQDENFLYALDNLLHLSFDSVL